MDSNTEHMKRIVEIVLHLLFWLVYLVWMPYMWYSGIMKGGYMTGTTFFNFWSTHEPISNRPPLYVLVAVFYILYFATSYGLHQKRSFRAYVYLGWSIVLTIAMAMVLLGSEDYVIHNVWETGNFIILPTWGIFAGVLKGIILWLVDVSEKRVLQKKQLKSENALLLLKAQLNPHFLFNSLNNIDILIEESPKVASGYLKKLSDILRYVLYETKEDETTLAREIEQISNYIELQKIRTSNRSYVDFEVVGTVGDQRIVPMIFLPFIENAFKFSKDKSKEHAIAIRFELEEKFVRMTCRNYYETRYLDVVKNEGLGIETIRERLRMLYPGKHELDIQEAENWFTVILKIAL